MPRGGPLRLGLVRSLRDLTFRAGQEDAKGGALPGPSGHGDVAPVLFHDPVDHRQPQSRSLADLLRGVEGLEDVLHGLGVHAVARVRDR